MANKFMTVKNVGIDKYRPEGDAVLLMRPVELQMKEDGAKDDTVSFMIVMDSPALEFRGVGEFSLATISDCFEQLGFKLTKK